MLALKGITKFRSPTKADVTSPNIQTTTWPLSTVMEASLRVCREQRDMGKGGRKAENEEKKAKAEKRGGGTQRQTQVYRIKMSADNRKLGQVHEVKKNNISRV